MPALRTLTIIAFVSLPLAAAAAEPTACAATGAAAGDSRELTDIINGFSKRTGKKFIIDPRVRANPDFAGIDPDKITYEQLLSTLTVHQFASVEQGDHILVLPDAYARQLPTPVYTSRNFKATADEIVTLVLPVKGICSAHIVPVLRPLMPQAAHMAAYPDINTLILSDHAANLRRVITVIEALERNAPGGGGCQDGEAAKK